MQLPLFISGILNRFIAEYIRQGEAAFFILDLDHQFTAFLTHIHVGLIGKGDI